VLGDVAISLFECSYKDFLCCTFVKDALVYFTVSNAQLLWDIFCVTQFHMIGNISVIGKCRSRSKSNILRNEESASKLTKLNAEESTHVYKKSHIPSFLEKKTIIVTMVNTARGEEAILTFPIQTVDSREQQQYLILH
jgi:hypothetical protein